MRVCSCNECSAFFIALVSLRSPVYLLPACTSVATFNLFSSPPPLPHTPAFLQLLNQMDGFDVLGRVKMIMATNRPDVLDPALLRPGRLDRKIEICLPNEQARLEILKIHSAPITKKGDIDYEAIVKLSEEFNGADLRNVCTEAGVRCSVQCVGYVFAVCVSVFVCVCVCVCVVYTCLCGVWCVCGVYMFVWCVCFCVCICLCVHVLVHLCFTEVV